MMHQLLTQEKIIPAKQNYNIILHLNVTMFDYLNNFKEILEDLCSIGNIVCSI